MKKFAKPIKVAYLTKKPPSIRDLDFSKSKPKKIAWLSKTKLKRRLRND